MCHSSHRSVRMTPLTLLTIFFCLCGQICASPTSQVQAQFSIKSTDIDTQHTSNEHTYTVPKSNEDTSSERTSSEHTLSEHTSNVHTSNEHISNEHSVDAVSGSLRHNGHLLSPLDTEQTNSLTVEHEQRQTTIPPTRDNPADIKPTNRHLAFVKPSISTIEPAFFEKIMAPMTIHPVPKEAKVVGSTKFDDKDEISVSGSKNTYNRDELPSTGAMPDTKDKLDIPKTAHTYSVTPDSGFFNHDVQEVSHKRLKSSEANNHQEDLGRGCRPRQGPTTSSGQHKCFPDHFQDDMDDDPEAPRVSDSSPIVFGQDFHQTIPCNCFKTPAGLIADCYGCSLSTVPGSLPFNIAGLDLDLNALTELNLPEIFALYPRLKYLSVRSNKIKRIIQKCSDTTEFPLKSLHLEDNNITSLDNCSLHHMPNLTHLYLANNKVSSLNNNTFPGLRSLLMLNLSFNNLTDIQNGTFDSCSNIYYLSLANNRYLSYYPSRMRPLAFRKLKRLRKLVIHGSSYTSTSYPDEALSYMTNLETLVIDGLKSANPPNLASLKNLKNLSVGQLRGECRITNLTSDFFRNLPSLIKLKLQGCKVSSIDPSVFATLKNLKYLQLEYFPNLKIESAFKSLSQISADSPLENVMIKHIIVHREMPCRYLTEESAQYIQHLRLKSLDLSDNFLAIIPKQFFSKLPKTLECLDLQDNKFDVNTFKIKNIAPLTNIKTLIVSKQNIPPTRYFGDHKIASDLEPSHTNQHGYGHAETFLASFSEHPEVSHICNRSQLISTTKQILSREDADKIYANLEKHISVPPNLTKIYASKFTFFGETLLTFKAVRDTNLKILDFSHSLSKDWGKGSLPSHVQEVHLEGNYCDNIHTNFFPSNNSLESLYLQHNFLGPQFAYDKKGEIFKDMKTLRYLNISNNLIFHLPYRFFEGFNNLQKLIIADNKIQNFNVTLAHLTSLMFINLQRNSISWISRNTRNDLDSIASLHPVELDLTLNPLPCTCEGIELLHWMQTSNVRMLRQDFLFCVNERGNTRRIGNIDDRVQELRQRCFPLTYVIIISVSFFLVFVICVSSVVLHRHRWRLIYIKNVLFVRWFGYTPSIAAGQTRRKFDAFIIYAEEDRDFVLHDCLEELERRRGHKLCVADRDFLPGSYITSNIICAVRNSTFTVPVLTPDFLHGQYCEYSTQMATYEAIFENRPTLHVLVKSPVQREGLYHDLLVALKSNKYVEMPQGPDGECVELWQDFWDRLSRVIGHGDHDKTDERPALDLSQS